MWIVIWPIWLFSDLPSWLTPNVDTLFPSCFNASTKAKLSAAWSFSGLWLLCLQLQSPHGRIFLFNAFSLAWWKASCPSPSCVFFMGYYTQEEQALRQSWWFSASGGWNVIDSALNYGFAQISSEGLHKWQYLYLLAGTLTVLFGAWFFSFPDSAASAGFLAGNQRAVAVERLRKGQTGMRCQKFKGYQVRESFLDVKIWILFTMITDVYLIPNLQMVNKAVGWQNLMQIFG